MSAPGFRFRTPTSSCSIGSCSGPLVSQHIGRTDWATNGLCGFLFSFGDIVSSTLYVDSSLSVAKRAEFKRELTTAGRVGSKRALYEKYLKDIGANGILDGIEELWPKCHSEAHDLGKVIQANVKDVSTSLLVCRDGCYSGCMHGVLMEAFAGARDAADPEGHVDVEIVKGKMDEICEKDTTMTSAYSPGDCAHATGHALMVLADYHVDEAIDYCDEFTNPHMRYYCATGAYMEYSGERDRIDVAAGARTFYPCDVGKYPAACARYKMVYVISRLVKKRSDVAKLIRSCNQLDGAYRVGCYHGAGNGFMGLIAMKKLALAEVCGEARGDDRTACIDGAMERMSKYHHERAKEVCTTISGDDKKQCEAAVGRGMYDMDKDLSLYVQ